ncbi:MAG: isocitrate/isopropylmalate dehydrogenase family protein [Firmicutes bacterium]|nr:isocitrate/isopropylmalate dehydrogenase family protein [Bacillota bacterium]
MNYNQYIDEACEKFRSLLVSQLERQNKMEKAKDKKDFSKLGKIVIGIVGGDGIGPAITNHAVTVLENLLDEEIKSGKVELKRIDGLTIENRERVGKAVPDEVMKEIKSCDVLLKGPTTTPKGGTMESANVTIRRELDLFANVRPVKVPSLGIDWIFFRENTEGEYALGSKGVEIPEKLAMDFKVTTKGGTERIARAAFDHAKANGKNKVAIITKANVIKKTDGNFSLICHEVAKDYPGIVAEDYYADIMTASLIKPAVRTSYQVFVLPNLYGDIISDEAAEIQGGVGTAGSANIGNQYAMFEAIHGSAVRMVEDGREQFADPSSMFKATEMLLRHIGYVEKADRLENALISCQQEGQLKVTGRANGATGADYANYVMSKL